MVRAEIITVAKKAADAWRNTDTYHQAAQIIDMLVEELEQNPTLTTQNEWVSVEDRLPQSIINKVLVYCENGYIGYGHYEKYQGEEMWYNLESGEPFASWNLENCSPYKVTHWMPLPNPPEREDGDVNHV